MRHDYNPYGAQDEAEERRREAAAYQEAVEEDLDERANNRVGELPDNTLSNEINTLLAMAGDKRGELISDYNVWLFDVCRAVEEQMI
ncbi:hypothetical protein [Xenorhabdus littoralis]|uniref:hypothetical protein n=1 Tax=Xenorhabdus littoralis TaxID=2582835 RepID=UPI0029E7CC46|nr:hypothetical protein [Xenorhabdus sp. psl]MDX7992620.1 hypothetical protein [Xenorhabdus sp. psl]